MRVRIHTCVFALVACLAYGESNVFAQGRGGFGVGQQQNQLGGLGQANPGGFNAGGQVGGQGGRAGQGGLGGQQQGIGQQRNRQQGGLQQGPQRDGFIGSDAEQLRNQLQNQNPNRRRASMIDFAIENFNQMRESGRQGRGRRNQKPPVRVKLRPLFTVSQPSSAELATRVRTRVDRALPSDVVSGSQISFTGRTATIQGSVQSEYDKKLAAKMIAIQPGVSQVENRLTIAPGQDQPLLFVP